MRNYLVTGAAGFIGSEFVRQLAGHANHIVVLDALTYAGHLENLSDVQAEMTFVKGRIQDPKTVAAIFAEYPIDTVVNFAAESHVDRSIEKPADFVDTNVVGVSTLLTASVLAWEKRSEADRANFRFVQVSTDEVYGQLGETGYFTEESPYAPSSPYSASKAGSDLLARAWHHTYKLPVIVTNCSNNYGPRQYPEKLIPNMIRCALSGKSLPVYGDGRNVRDWIHVSDHSTGVRLAVEKGRPGETYCFGGRSERRNLDVVKLICAELDEVRPRAHGSYADQIKFVEDRKGHDWRYAIDDTKAERELGFTRRYTKFEDGLKQTIRWYLDNEAWVEKVLKSES